MTVRSVDHAALRTNQAFIIGLLLVAFLLDLWPVAAFVGVIMAVGTLWPQAALFKRVYKHVLRPLSLVKPDVQPDNPQPHLFAQGVGAVFTLGATAAVLLGAPTLGWGLAWVVIVLATVNLLFGFCAGCFVYYQLNRLGLPGFRAAPVQE